MYPYSARADGALALEEALERVRRRLVEPEMCFGPWVHEAEVRGMEHHPRRFEEGPGKPFRVQRFADQRVSDVSEVNADLMRPPSFEAASDERAAR